MSGSIYIDIAIGTVILGVGLILVGLGILAIRSAFDWD